MEQKPTVGRIVHFAPPQDCVGPASLTLYPAIIVQVNQNAVPEWDVPDESVELATFGPNSLYFQHRVKYSPEPKAGHWFWPAQV